MNKIVSYNYKNNQIELFKETEKYGMINATKTATIFGKRVQSYLKSDRTKEYIEAVLKKLNKERKIELQRRFLNGIDSDDSKAPNGALLSVDDLVKIIHGGKDSEHGTWLHTDLAIDFARWLDSDFAVWCDDILKKLFNKGIVYLKDELKDLKVELEHKDLIIKDLEVNKNIIDMSKLNDKIPISYVAQDLNIGRNVFFDILRNDGYLMNFGFNRNKPYQRYINQGLFTYNVKSGRLGHDTHITLKGYKYFIEKYKDFNKP